MLPKATSAYPSAYISAVSKKLIPESRHFLMILVSYSRVSYLKLTMFPKLIAETLRPVFPRLRYCMLIVFY